VAEPPSYPARPRVGLNLALGALVGLVVGLGLAFFIEYLDTSVKTMEDVESLLGVPVLAIIPQGISLLHKAEGDIPDAEAYRILRTNIEFNRRNPDANTISLVSGGPGEGKSTTIANLAFICAQGGYSTLIVDADLRRPVQHQLFDVSNEIGLTNYLTTEMDVNSVILPTTVENLFVLPSGVLPSDAVGILNSQRMSDTIAELKLRYDIIFFDSPPILGVSDASVIASEVDQTVIIVQHRRFPRAMLTRVKQAILGVGGTVLGVVMNNVDLKHDQNYYYYTNYYGYYGGTRTKTFRRGRAQNVPAETTRNGSGESDEEY
jgi:succinoglycan biosynthesis transport protein ExoP